MGLNAINESYENDSYCKDKKTYPVVWFVLYVYFKALKSQNQTCKGIEFLSQPEIF